MVLLINMRVISIMGLSADSDEKGDNRYDQ